MEPWMSISLLYSQFHLNESCPEPFKSSLHHRTIPLFLTKWWYFSYLNFYSVHTVPNSVAHKFFICLLHGRFILLYSLLWTVCFLLAVMNSTKYIYIMLPSKDCNIVLCEISLGSHFSTLYIFFHVTKFLEPRWCNWLVGVVIRLWIGQSRLWIPSRGRRFSLLLMSMSSPEG